MKNAKVVAEAVANYETPRVNDGELLDFVLGKGTRKILDTHPEINELARMEVGELSRLLGAAKGAKLAAFFELTRRATAPRARDTVFAQPESVYAYLRPRMAHLTREEFRVLLLDTRHRLIRDVRIAEGGLASCAISSRDVFAPAIREDAPAMILIHNHPSGDPTPSREDKELTRKLAATAQALGISVVDHIIIADGGFSSLAEMGLL